MLYPIGAPEHRGGLLSEDIKIRQPIQERVTSGSGIPFRLSVLDQSPIPEGATAGDALRNTLDLARLADELGYHRYWLAEHHGTPGLACASPEVMIGPVAAATARIRVGSGGVMLPHYSPLKVAETFSMLSNLFPGRIDLGIGRAAGTSASVAFALQRDRRQAAPDDFREQLRSSWDISRIAPALPAPSRRCSVLPRRAPSGPPNWDCLTSLPTSSTPGRSHGGCLPPELCAVRAACHSARRSGRMGPLRLHRRGSVAAFR